MSSGSDGGGPAPPSPPRAAAGRVRPAYGGASLVNLVSSVAGRFGVATGHPGLAGGPDLSGTGRIVLLICDALGLGQFQHHLAGGALPRLGRLLAAGDARLDRLTSVFPSTTAAALSSLHTGRTPAEHGHLGFALWLGGGPEVTDMLAGRDRRTGEPRAWPAGPPSIFPGLGRAGVTCRVVNSAAFAESALSAWHFAGAEYRRWYSANSLPSLLAEAARHDPPLYTWAYWPDHDPVCHVHGPCGAEAADELAVFDLVVERILRGLPRDGRTALLIAGDHGQAALDPARAVPLEPLAPSRPAGDRTAAYLRSAPGLAEALAPYAEVRAMDEIWAEGWFGGPPATAAHRARTGDLLAVAHPGRQFLWTEPGAEPAVPWRGGHGGWSAEEMEVPLVSIRL